MKKRSGYLLAIMIIIALIALVVFHESIFQDIRDRFWMNEKNIGRSDF